MKRFSWVSRLLCSLLVALPTIALVLPVNAGSTENRLGNVQVEGLRRTRVAVVRQIVALETGDPVDENTVEGARQRLLAAGIFSDIRIESLPAEDATVDLLITLTEKWTLLAFPFFSTAGGQTRGGLFVIESNLFGYNKQLIGAGIIGTNGYTGFVGYIDPAVLGSRFRTTLTAAAAQATIVTTLPDGTPVRSFETQRSTVAAAAGYRFTDWLESGVGIAASGVTARPLAGEFRTLSSPSVYQPFLEARARNTRVEGYLTYGRQATVRAGLFSVPGMYATRATLEVGVRPWWDHRLRLQAEGALATLPVELEADLGGRDGFRTLPPDSITATDYLGTAAFWDVPVWNAGWGALVLSTFVEGGLYRGNGVDWQRFYGPGAGLRVYLRQVALPAIGLDGAYNALTGRVTVAFALGGRP